MTEEQLQASIFQNHWNYYTHERKCLFHVNNKAKNKIEGNQMKAKGVIAGVSDFIYLGKNGIVLFIELKTEDGEQSKDQKEFELIAKERGHLYFIVRTEKDFFDLIKKYN